MAEKVREEEHGVPIAFGTKDKKKKEQLLKVMGEKEREVEHDVPIAFGTKYKKGIEHLSKGEDIEYDVSIFYAREDKKEVEQLFKGEEYDVSIFYDKRDKMEVEQLSQDLAGQGVICMLIESDSPFENKVKDMLQYALKQSRRILLYITTHYLHDFSLIMERKGIMDAAMSQQKQVIPVYGDITSEEQRKLPLPLRHMTPIDSREEGFLKYLSMRIKGEDIEYDVSIVYHTRDKMEVEQLSQDLAGQGVTCMLLENDPLLGISVMNMFGYALKQSRRPLLYITTHNLQDYFLMLQTERIMQEAMSQQKQVIPVYGDITSEEQRELPLPLRHMTPIDSREEGFLKHLSMRIKVEDIEYDVSIVYHTRDKMEVEQLSQDLAGQGVTCLLIESGFLLGIRLKDMFGYALKQSRRPLLYITTHYLQNHLLELQAEMIMQEAMSQQKQVIPVYGDITSEEQRKLPLPLRHLIPIYSRKEGFLKHLSMRIKGEDIEYDVSIVYHTRDKMEVEQLSQDLAGQGVTCMLIESDPLHGMRLKDMFDYALKQSRSVLLYITTHLLQDPFWRYEAERIMYVVMSQQKQVIPVYRDITSEEQRIEPLPLRHLIPIDSRKEGFLKHLSMRIKGEKYDVSIFYDKRDEMEVEQLSQDLAGQGVNCMLLEIDPLHRMRVEDMFDYALKQYRSVLLYITTHLLQAYEVRMLMHEAMSQQKQVIPVYGDITSEEQRKLPLPLRHLTPIESKKEGFLKHLSMRIKGEDIEYDVSIFYDGRDEIEVEQLFQDLAGQGVTCMLIESNPLHRNRVEDMFGYALKQSRSVLLYITTHYLQKYEAERIMHEAMSQQKQVIPVYGDITSEEQRKLPLPLRYLMPIDSRKEGFLKHLSMRINGEDIEYDVSIVYDSRDTKEVEQLSQDLAGQGVTCKLIEDCSLLSIGISLRFTFSNPLKSPRKILLYITTHYMHDNGLRRETERIIKEAMSQQIQVIPVYGVNRKERREFLVPLALTHLIPIEIGKEGFLKHLSMRIKGEDIEYDVSILYNSRDEMEVEQLSQDLAGQGVTCMLIEGDSLLEMRLKEMFDYALKQSRKMLLYKTTHYDAELKRETKRIMDEAMSKEKQVIPVYGDITRKELRESCLPLTHLTPIDSREEGFLKHLSMRIKGEDVKYDVCIFYARGDEEEVEQLSQDLAGQGVTCMLFESGSPLVMGVKDMFDYTLKQSMRILLYITAHYLHDAELKSETRRIMDEAMSKEKQVIPAYRDITRKELRELHFPLRYLIPIDSRKEEFLKRLSLRIKGKDVEYDVSILYDGKDEIEVEQLSQDLAGQGVICMLIEGDSLLEMKLKDRFDYAFKRSRRILLYITSHYLQDAELKWGTERIMHEAMSQQKQVIPVYGDITTEELRELPIPLRNSTPIDSRKEGFLKSLSMRIKGEDIEYDVSILYDRADEKEIEQLAQDLAGQGVTCMLLESDFLHGIRVKDMFDYALKQSRRILLYITAHYLRDPLLKGETTEKIMDEAMSQQKDVIPVYGDITREELRELLVPLSVRHLIPIYSREGGFLKHLLMRIKDAALSQEDTVQQKNDLELALISSGIYIQKFSMDYHGGYVHLKEVGVTLVVPGGSLPEGTVTEMYLGVSWRPGDRPNLRGKETRTSPIVVCGPHDLTFQKPVYLSFPHCIPHVDDAEMKIKFWTSKTDLMGTCRWTTEESDPVVIYSKTRCTAALWNLCKYTTSSVKKTMLATAFGKFDPRTELLRIVVHCISRNVDDLAVLDSCMERMGLKRIVHDGTFKLYVCPHSDDDQDDGDQGDGDHDNKNLVCDDDHDVLVTLKDYQGWTLRGENEKALDYQRMIDDNQPFCTFSLNPESTTSCPPIFTSKILVAQQGLKGKDARLSSVELEVCHPLHEITKVAGTEPLNMPAVQLSSPDLSPWGLNQSQTLGPLQQQSPQNPLVQQQWGLPAPEQSHHTTHGSGAYKQNRQPQYQYMYVQHQSPQLYSRPQPHQISHLPKPPHSGGPEASHKQNMPNIPIMTELPFPLEQEKTHMLMQQLPQMSNYQVQEPFAPSEWNLASISMPSVDKGHSDNSLLITPETMAGSPIVMAQSTQQMPEEQSPAEVSIPLLHGKLEQLSLSKPAHLSPSGAKPSGGIEGRIPKPAQLLTSTTPSSVSSNEGHMKEPFIKPQQHSNEITHPIIPISPHVSSSVLVAPSVPINQDYETCPVVETPSQLELSEQRMQYQLQCQQQQHQQFPNLASQQQRPHPQALSAQLYGRPDLAQTLCVDVRQTNMAATYGAGATWMETAGQRNVFVQNIGRLEIHHNGDQKLMSVAPPAHVHVLQRYLPLGAKANLDRIFKIPGVWEAVVLEHQFRDACCPEEPLEFVFCHLQCSFEELASLLMKIKESVKEFVDSSEIEDMIQEVTKARVHEVECENLRKHLSYIADEGIDIRRLLDFLFSKSIISYSDREEIKWEKTSSEKCSLLLLKVLKCSLDKDPVRHLQQWFIDEDRHDIADLLAVKPEDEQESYPPDEALRPGEYQGEEPALRQIQSPEVAA